MDENMTEAASGLRPPDTVASRRAAALTLGAMTPRTPPACCRASMASRSTPLAWITPAAPPTCSAANTN